MKEARELILKLHLQGKSNAEIMKVVRSFGVSRMFIIRAVKRWRNTGDVQPAKKPGRQRKTRTKKMIKRVRDRLRRNPCQSVRKIGRALGINKSSIHEITKYDLGLKGYKKQRVHGLTDKQKKARIQKCKILINRLADREMIFSDEKMFILQDTYNSQNNRVYSTSLDTCPTDKLKVQRFQNSSKVMVWGAISPRGQFPLLFVEHGAKINSNYYINEILERHLLTNAEKLYGDEYYCFQQDSAPAHRAKQTATWLKENLSDFIAPSDWPASSPDINPLDFCIWGYMMDKLSSMKYHNLDQFKSCLLKIWNEIPIEVVRAACNGFMTRMRKVVKEKGDRIELK